MTCGKDPALYTTPRACIEHGNNEQIAHDDAVKIILKPEEILAKSLDQLAKAFSQSNMHIKVKYLTWDTAYLVVVQLLYISWTYSISMKSNNVMDLGKNAKL